MLCRDAEVLSLFAAIINKLKERMQKEVPKIFEAVFQVTLQMITKDFSVRFATLVDLNRCHPCKHLAVMLEASL